MKRLGLVAVGLLAIGCQTGTLPDPNDPTQEFITPEALRANLSVVSDSLLERRVNREITTEQYRELMVQAARDFVKNLNLKVVSPQDAWQYAEVFRAAKDWQSADQMLVRAVKYAKTIHNEDRRINDTLRLAHVRAAQGKVEDAIKIASETLDAKPIDSAPILPSVFFEITPIARGKGFDDRLAALLEAAVDKHLLTQVDPGSDPGRDFILARPTHVHYALQVASELYHKVGMEAQSKKALANAALAESRLDVLTAQAAKAAAIPPPAAPSANQPRL